MFIQDMTCISAQKTYDGSFFESVADYFDGNKIRASEPEYRGMVSGGQLRRMSKLMRMSMATAVPLINRNKNIDGVIMASSNGSVDRSLRFLSQIIEYSEGSLTPTDFVQSTANCIAGGLALIGKITGYNTTHVNKGLSFESALLDALLQFMDDDAHQLLVGGGEEISEQYYNIESKRDIYKEEAINTKELLTSNTNGTVLGEGVSMFVLSALKNADSVAQINDVDMITTTEAGDVADRCAQFLKRNHLSPSDVDGILFGRNGDVRTDNYYDHLANQLFSAQGHYVFKSLIGDYCTASAFATWLAAKVLSGENMPGACVWKAGVDRPKNMLIYNHCEGVQHGFILMSGV